MTLICGSLDEKVDWRFGTLMWISVSFTNCSSILYTWRARLSLEPVDTGQVPRSQERKQEPLNQEKTGPQSFWSKTSYHYYFLGSKYCAFNSFEHLLSFRFQKYKSVRQYLSTFCRLHLQQHQRLIIGSHLYVQVKEEGCWGDLELFIME